MESCSWFFVEEHKLVVSSIEYCAVAQAHPVHISTPQGLSPESVRCCSVIIRTLESTTLRYHQWRMMPRHSFSSSVLFWLLHPSRRYHFDLRSYLSPTSMSSSSSSDDDESSNGSSFDECYINCGCQGCTNGEMMYDPMSRFHVQFCLNCDRCYCFGAGPTGASCGCCQPCYLKQCSKIVTADTPTTDEDDSDEFFDAVEEEASNHDDEDEDDDEYDDDCDEEEEYLAMIAQKSNKDAIPLAKQSEIRTVVRASSSGSGSRLDTLLTEREGSKCWISARMKPRDRKEQFVEFQLSPDKALRRVGSVEVKVSIQPVDFRIDYSTDGINWERGPALWGMDGSFRSHNDINNLNAKLVRIVCEKEEDEYRSLPQVGFAYVNFNRVAEMRQSLCW